MHIISRDWANAARLLMLAALMAPLLAACGGYGATVKRGAFTSKEYGVAVSPRVTRDPNPPKGGGRYLVGKPYKVRGEVYTPQVHPEGYMAAGTASWYGSDFHGRRTANGEIFSANAITGAHPTLPLPSYVRVTNLDNGRSVMVRVNDRGPYIHGRIMDLSHRAAEILGYVDRGMGNVQVSYVGPAPLNGDDTRMLLASVNRPTRMEEQGQTRFAMIEPQQQVLEPFPQPAARAARAEANTLTFPDEQQAERQPQTLGTYDSRDLAAEITALLGYAEGAEVTGAHAAVNAMASRDTGLRDWVNVVDEDARAIKLQLGVFRDPEGAAAIAQAFALLAAVDEEQVTLGDGQATRLTLSHLKPGVARQDVLDLARELGLRDIVLY